MSDSGGNLLRILERRDQAWTPLLRTNRIDLHPLWFGIYGGFLYHHGAGFRKAVARGIGASGPNRWQRGEPLPLVGTAARKLTSFRIEDVRGPRDQGQSAPGRRDLRRAPARPGVLEALHLTRRARPGPRPVQQLRRTTRALAVAAHS